MEEKKGFVTIGYGKTDIQTFIRTLLRYKVNCIVDVRSSPYSKYSEHYNKEVFAAVLAKHNISYKWLGNSLGGRPKDDLVYDEKGIVDYEKLIKTELFLSGLKELEELSVTNNVAIMCSEQEPIRCHRFLAISRELAKREFRVVHIKDFNSYVKQTQLEDDLVQIHFGSNVQLDIFSKMNDAIAESYTKQNLICAYRRK
ncbi:MAG: DUF488 domain-containing protein [Clostridia bacterium]|nr:DUF488 domain-containing protein [Clostridia bacterium]MDD4386841.1 DUF488 domain-containing protein [Clostridia bacterium]